MDASEAQLGAWLEIDGSDECLISYGNRNGRRSRSNGMLIALETASRVIYRKSARWRSRKVWKHAFTSSDAMFTFKLRVSRRVLRLILCWLEEVVISPMFRRLAFLKSSRCGVAIYNSVCFDARQCYVFPRLYREFMMRRTWLDISLNNLCVSRVILSLCNASFTIVQLHFRLFSFCSHEILRTNIL